MFINTINSKKKIFRTISFWRSLNFLWCYVKNLKKGLHRDQINIQNDQDLTINLKNPKKVVEKKDVKTEMSSLSLYDSVPNNEGNLKPRQKDKANGNSAISLSDNVSTIGYSNNKMTAKHKEEREMGPVYGVEDTRQCIWKWVPGIKHQ